MERALAKLGPAKLGGRYVIACRVIGIFLSFLLAKHWIILFGLANFTLKKIVTIVYWIYSPLHDIDLLQNAGHLQRE